MNEALPPTEPTLKPGVSPAAHRIRWHRISVYAGSIALIIAMWMCAALWMLREHPERFVAYLLSQMPAPSSAGAVTWENRRTLKIDDVKIGGFFYAESIVVVASPIGLLRHHVAKVQINGGQLFTQPLYAAMDKATGSGDGLNWTIGRLEISRGTLMLQSLGDGLPAIPVRLGVRHPIGLNNLRLYKPDASPAMTEERTIEITNVTIVSPWDPVVPVFTFPLIRLRFSYADIWHHQIQGVELIRPTMYLGQDLFWFTTQFKKDRAATPVAGPEAPWQVAHFQVEYGQLAVNAFGQPVVHFPFFLETQVDHIRLDELDKISAKAAVVIKRLDQDYPDYKIQLVGLTGRLYFSLPPSDAAANNVVNTISIEQISWNDIPVTGVNSTVTFDPNGVYGKLNGKCEGGQLTGNFEFYYSKGFTWNADFFADKTNLQPIAEKMAGKYVNLTGELDGKLAVQGKVTDILNCQGLLTLPRPGVLEIKSMSELMKRLPADASQLKKDALKIAISNFQTYPYESGQLKIDYKPEGGVGSLHLDSPNGKRQFEVYWHPYESSKVAKSEDTK